MHIVDCESDSWESEYFSHAVTFFFSFFDLLLYSPEELIKLNAEISGNQNFGIVAQLGMRINIQESERNFAPQGIKEVNKIKLLMISPRIYSCNRKMFQIKNAPPSILTWKVP